MADSWEFVVENVHRLQDGSIAVYGQLHGPLPISGEPAELHTPSGVRYVPKVVTGRSVTTTFDRASGQTSRSEPRPFLALWDLRDDPIPEGSVVRGPVSGDLAGGAAR